MKAELDKVEKYPVITPEGSANLEFAVLFYLVAIVISIFLWIIFSWLFGYCVEVQTIILCGALIFAYWLGAPAGGFVRTKLELKAKGLDIKSPRVNAIMPWDWLAKVEISQSAFSFFPHYVYFKFKDRSDILILWEDVRDDMDSTTLINCVRTWAPHAEVKGDAKIAKSESIATYTELWLKDLSTAKSESRRTQDQLLPEGTILSDSYEIERILSGGGQGTAYLASVLPHADFAGLPPQVVLKEFILPANERGMQKAKDSLAKEVTILRRINHPRIIRLYDFFVEDMRGYLAIEFIEGLTLRQLIERNGLPTEFDVARIGASLCDTISYLHELSPPIIHGDVTPDNIMLEPDGSVKLLDFDAAQELTRNKTNTVVGKHSYMSPEQFKGILGEASDVYALGCTLFFLLTGSDPEPISESCPGKVVSTVSERMDQIVSRATKLDQSKRFSNLKEMKVQFEQLG